MAYCVKADLDTRAHPDSVTRWADDDNDGSLDAGELAIVDEMIDRAETKIRSLTGISLVRIRDHGKLVRIEVGNEEMQRLTDIRLMRQISQYLRQIGYVFVTLDLEGYRSGSFDQAESRGG